VEGYYERAWPQQRHACSDRNLMQVGHDVPDGVYSRHDGLLVPINFQAPGIVLAGAKLLAQLGANVTAQNRIDHVTDFLRSVAQGRNQLVFLPGKRAYWLSESGRPLPTVRGIAARCKACRPIGAM
jgi:hypothetical protein